jgi:hypothetical protein
MSEEQTSTKFFGEWSPSAGYTFRTGTPYAEMLRDFEETEAAVKEEEILIASYGGDSYDGEAYVLYERDGELYEVNACHCSCFGLEGQWEPKLTTRSAIALRFTYFLHSHGPEVSDRVKEIVGVTT